MNKYELFTSGLHTFVGSLKMQDSFECMTSAVLACSHCSITHTRTVTTLWTLSPAHTSNNVQATLSNATSWTISFDNVECCFDIVAVCGNKVECCFDKVERCFDNVAGVDGALLLRWPRPAESAVSFCPSVYLTSTYLTWLTRGQHATQPAYIWARQ